MGGEESPVKVIINNCLAQEYNHYDPRQSKNPEIPKSQ